MSFGVSDGADFEYAAHSPPALYANPRHLVDRGFQRMVGEYVRFNRAARALLASDRDPSLNEWLRDEGFSQAFVDQLIVPQAAAVWSADPAQMETFPARFLVEFFDNHGMLGFRDRPQWRTVTGGSRDVRARAHARPRRCRLEHARRARRALRRPRRGRRRGLRRGRHRHALRPGAGACSPTRRAAEREVLGAIPYQANEAVLHTDASLMPNRRRAWASWNYHLGRRAGPSTVTYWMNRLQRLSTDRQFFVTLNRTAAIDPAKVIRTIDYAHPVFTRGGHARAAPPARGLRRQPHALRRRLLGVGLPRGRRPERPARRAIRGPRPRGGAGMSDAVYAGTVRHRRFQAKRQRVHAPGRLRVRRPGPAARATAGRSRFRPADYLSADAARARAGTTGPVRLLTTPRTFGVIFNPVSFYYCFEGGALHTVLAEVTNTPWGERHVYTAGDGIAKELHVSPLMGMDQTYRFVAPEPGATLSVHIESREHGERAFDATLNLRRKPFAMRGLLLGSALRTLPLIYLHALALRLRGVPGHPHPA